MTVWFAKISIWPLEIATDTAARTIAMLQKQTVPIMQMASQPRTLTFQTLDVSGGLEMKSVLSSKGSGAFDRRWVVRAGFRLATVAEDQQRKDDCTRNDRARCPGFQ